MKDEGGPRSRVSRQSLVHATRSAEAPHFACTEYGGNAWVGKQLTCTSSLLGDAYTGRSALYVHRNSLVANCNSNSSSSSEQQQQQQQTAAATAAMPSTPRSGEASPRRLGLSTLLRQRLSPCIPTHLSTCLPFLRRHPNSSSSSSSSSTQQQQQQQSLQPSCEAPQADPSVPLEGKGGHGPQKRGPPNSLKEGAAFNAPQMSLRPNSSPPSPRPAEEGCDSAVAPSQSDSSGLAASSSEQQQQALILNTEENPLLVQQLEELQKALSCWSSKLVAAQAAAAAELKQLLRRAEAAAVLQATEAGSP
ncbi:hypothetical protein ACSSS7_003455 [Eimeria intestinalis]